MIVESRFLDPKKMRGVGLRPSHYPHWHAKKDDLPWLEVMADNYLFQRGGPGLAHLDRIASRARCLVHGVGLSIAGQDPIDDEYVRELRALCERVDAKVVSDHLCFTRSSGRQSYDLLPIPFTAAMLQHVAERVAYVQEILGRRLALENVSSYVSFRESECSEMEFMRALCERTGCGILLDVNNIYVSARNHGHSALAEVARIDSRHVMQYHVAGHTEREGYLHDTHDQPVSDDVWNLCAHVLALVGARPFVLEYDGENASAEELEREIDAGLTRVIEAMNEVPSVQLSLAVGKDNCLGLSNARSQKPAHLAWQDSFLRVVHSTEPIETLLSREAALARLLEPATREHLSVYRLGYFSRVTATLAETLFEKASQLVSSDYMRGILGRYFETHPATAPSITACCGDVPSFAEGLDDVRKFVPWLPDFMRLCLARWESLTGPDPIVGQAQGLSPGTARLRQDARLVSSRYPLFALWQQADAQPELESGANTGVSLSEAQTLLLFKSAPTDLEMVVVPSSLVNFTDDLVRGIHVADALEEVEARGDEVQPEVIGAFLAALSKRNAWG